MALPFVLDNRSDATLHANGVRALVDTQDGGLAVATGYVNLGGLHLLAELADGRPTRLMLGAQPDPGLGVPVQPRELFEAQLRALGGERDFSRFPPSRAGRKLAAIEKWIDRPEVEVRRFTQRFLHGKAYLFGTEKLPRAALVTSANLTGAGLHSNMELGLTAYGVPGAEEAIRWFDQLWVEATPFEDELRELLFPVHGPVDPQDVYLRALLELHGPLQEDRDRGTRPTGLELASFQRDGYERARAIVRAHGGVIFADGVGTGKTEIGLAFIEERIKEDGVYALVVCPAQLKARWQERIDQSKLSAQVVSFNELASEEELAGIGQSGRRILSVGRDNYRLVVVDEAHALRNEDTTWYRSMERLLGGADKQVVLLTATPINNGLWDLYNLVMLFARHDRGLASAGIDSIKKLFMDAGANERDPENLSPDVLYPIADAVSVRRDRTFIEREYPGASFPDGTPVRFPTPTLTTARYDLDLAHPGLLQAVVDAIDALTMARYRPSAFLLEGEERSMEAQLGGLLRSGLLKRFESCWAACLATVERMIAAHDAFLVGWEQGHVLAGEILRKAAADEVDEAGLGAWIEDALEGDVDARPASEFDDEYADAVAADRTHLVGIRDRLAEMDASVDPKLALLAEVLEQCPSEKVAVFATYAATVRYLDENLPETIGGRSRVVVIGGDTNPDQRLEALGRFAPRTVVRDDYEPPHGEVDLLFATDVLSEGQNLQQAGAVVSYDMPWNPQRVVQRNGRVIRLMSPHEEVQLTTMLPEPGELEELLGLESRIQSKIKAAGLYGMESEVIDGLGEVDGEVDLELRNFAARLERGDEALLDVAEDDSGAFVGEELRRMIDRAAAEGELDRIEAMPWGVGAGFRQAPGGRSSGAPGIFFATRARGIDEEGYRYWRYVEIGADGSVSTDPPVDLELEILRRIDPNGGVAVADLEGLPIEQAWEIASASIVAEHNARGDVRAGQEQIGPLQRWALGLLRDPAVPLPSTDRAQTAIDALAVQRGSGVRRALGQIRERLEQQALSRGEAVAGVIEVVEDHRLGGVETLPPVEKITADDLGVVCWMAVLTAEAG